MKVMTIVGTRPEIIKLAMTIKEMDKAFEHVLVHTGQNYDYELNEIFFNELGIRKPDYFLEAAGENPAQSIGNVISKADEVLEKEFPDAVLFYGDTNSCLAVISAKRRKIPVFHMEAGNRCFDQRVPEELNRKVVDHLSDINMVITEHARRYLIQEGINPETIIKVGSSMKELLNNHKNDIENSKVLDALELEKGQYFIVSAHREENVDDKQNLTSLLNSLNSLANKYSCPIIFSTHPRTKKRIEEMGDVKMNSLVTFSKPFGFFDYIALQKNAKCVISDSGTITEESSILGFPAVTIRNTHERPEGMDEGTLIMSGLEAERILESIDVLLKQYNEDSQAMKVVQDYDVDNVSKKVVRLILSYTDYINKKVWGK